MVDIITDVLRIVIGILSIALVTALIFFFARKLIEPDSKYYFRLNEERMIMRDFEYRLERLNQERYRLEELSEKLVKDQIDREPYDRALKEKKDRLLNMASIAFHYIDRNAIKGYYFQKFRKPITKEIESEESYGKSKEMRGSIPKLVESKTSDENIEKIKTTMKMPEISEEEMFLHYQKDVIENEQVLLDLEMLDIDLTEFNMFEELISELKTKYNLRLDDAILNEPRVTLRGKATETTIKRLERASDWVIVDGMFLIEDKEDYYKYSLKHPINRYLNESKNEIIIIFSVLKENIEQNFRINYKDSIGAAVPIKVFGKLWKTINLKQENFELNLTPYAVY